MANQTYKTLTPSSDIVRNRTNLHEAIPVTGTIVSGTYSHALAPTNVKNPAHGMFQMVFDYPYLSSSANHIFDITNGYHTSSVNAVAANTQDPQKLQIYNNMAQQLVGYNSDGTIKPFPLSGSTSSGVNMTDLYFINFARLLGKDEIQKGTFYMDVGVGANYVTDATLSSRRVRVVDASGSTTYRTDSPAGEYGLLYASASSTVINMDNTAVCGLIYYQAGVVAITSSLFMTGSSVNGYLTAPSASQAVNQKGYVANSYGTKGPANNFNWLFASASIQTAADSLRHRIHNIYFANTTELNSTIYFCRANAGEFNYSSNPTYLTASQIRVKEVATDQPISYITTVGLYGADNELLASAKLSEPLKKTSSNEFTLRVRLDY
jgi:hypothetical protein